MMSIQPLNFPSLQTSRTSRDLDLRLLLHLGGASLNSITHKFKTYSDAQTAGLLGPLMEHRISLILRIYEQLSAAVAAGYTPSTIYSQIRAVFTFYSWADSVNAQVDLQSGETCFFAWCERLSSRVRAGEILEKTANGLAQRLDAVLYPALGLPHNLTQFSAVRWGRRNTVPSSDKVDIREMERFGVALASICRSLTPEVTFGPLPIQIPVPGGGVLIDWCRLPPADKVIALRPESKASTRAASLKARRAWELDQTPRTRRNVINLRIRCELLIFIAQTGMNLAQAAALTRESLRTKVEGSDVLYFRAHKARRGGEVVFRAFKSYRHHFTRYLAWLDRCRPDHKLFFPLIRENEHNWKPINFISVQRHLREMGIEFFGPQILRRARTNWLYDRLGDPQISAEASQHSLPIHLNYLQPNFPRAAKEISSFNRASEQAISSVAPGFCASPFNPKHYDGLLSGSPIPDCTTPSGCLFCEHHRDVNSFDYVWSLTSYRRLKALELQLNHTRPLNDQRPPTVLVLDRVAQKLCAMQESGVEQAQWVDEAAHRSREGRHHPMWDGFISLLDP